MVRLGKFALWWDGVEDFEKLEWGVVKRLGWADDCEIKCVIT